MLWALLAAVLLAWMLYAIFENGPSVAGVVILVLLVWALIDRAG